MDEYSGWRGWVGNVKNNDLSLTELIAVVVE